MNSLQQALSEADENYFIGISNKGIYKRACKDLEEADISVTYQEDSAEVKISGETCLIKNPLFESSCSCPSRSVCRHLISAMLWLKKNSDTDSEDSEEDFEEDIPAGLPEMLRQELTEVTVAQIKKALGSQLKTTLAEVNQIQLEESSILSGTLPDGTAVRLLYPLKNSTCACHKKELCVHKASVILAWKLKENLINLSDFETLSTTLSDAEISEIRESAKRSYALLYDVLKWGLVRLPENMAEHLEASAVQSHALKMADAERMLRDLGSKLSDSRERRAIFQTESFLKKLCACAEHLNQLQSQTISEEMLGQFRRSYETLHQDLAILPIGQRTVNNSEYAGEVYYFLNLNPQAEQKFLTFSDIRPVFYESTAKNNRKEVTIPWNAGVPMKALMKSKMILKNAKISEGKLSASKDTNIVMKTTANLNCPELQNLIYTDFQKLAVDISEDSDNPERLCLLHPMACVSSAFDTHSQRYQMEIADSKGNIIAVQVRYQAETKDFISMMERIGKELLENTDKIYTLLCSAYFENGKLTLFPIECYDFIEIPVQEEFTLPLKYAQAKAEYSNQILEFFQEIQSILCGFLQSGLQSSSCTVMQELSGKAEKFGMQGLAELLSEFSHTAEISRHSMQEEKIKLMQSYTAIQNYLQAGFQKLDVLCALWNMKPKSAFV